MSERIWPWQGGGPANTATTPVTTLAVPGALAFCEVNAKTRLLANTDVVSDKAIEVLTWASTWPYGETRTQLVNACRALAKVRLMPIVITSEGTNRKDAPIVLATIAIDGRADYFYPKEMQGMVTYPMGSDNAGKGSPAGKLAP